MVKEEEWVNPQIIEFNLSKWDKEKMTHYIGFYNGLYFGCAVNATDITGLEIARAVLDVELKKKFYSSRLSKSECTINDKKVTFYISVRRTEVAYALPR